MERKDTVPVTVLVPRELYKELKEVTAVDRRSMSQWIVFGLQGIMADRKRDEQARRAIGHTMRVPPGTKTGVAP